MAFVKAFYPGEERVFHHLLGTEGVVTSRDEVLLGDYVGPVEVHEGDKSV